MINIVGQKNILKEINNLIENGFPKFIILIGKKGSGKKYISQYISEKLNIPIVPCSNKVEDIRNVILESYQQRNETIYLFSDVDNMSINAKNALLKVTEEPSKSSYFIMTVKDKNNVLPTILSRGIVLNIEPYTIKDINNVLDLYNYNLSKKEKDIILNICNVPGEIDILLSYGISDFYSYCERVIDNIAEVDGSNAFKILDNLDVKGTGWDLQIFLDTVSYICLERLKNEKFLGYAECIKICSKYKRQLNIVGINKQMLMDAWILDVRKVL